MMHKSILISLVIILALYAAATHGQEQATYSIPLTAANQQKLVTLRGNVGACGSDPSYLGSVNTANGVLVMVSTTAPTTIADFTSTTCGKALLSDNWATTYTVPSPSTDADLQTECWVSGTPRCGSSTTTSSLCPCSASESGLYYVPMTSELRLYDLIKTSTGACYQNPVITATLNTADGIIVFVASAPGSTLWDFEQTPCGSQIKNDYASKPVVTGPTAQAVIDECLHGDHGHCGTTAPTTCPCSPAVPIVYTIPPAHQAAFQALFLTGGICATPKRVTILNSILTLNGPMLYALTSPGKTQLDFEQTPCGAKIVGEFQPTALVDSNAEAVVDACWAHGDHGHCGPSACPCPKPPSLSVTPLVFTLNMTHTETEGLLYFNNFFMSALRSNPDCNFSRYLATYADRKGFVLRVYADQFKTAACTNTVIDSVVLSSFRAYYAKAVIRWNNTPEDDGHDHSGHQHFEMRPLAAAATPTQGLIAAGIIDYHIEPKIDLDVDACWNPLTDGIKCMAEDSKCNVKCALGTHCQTNSQCGTGVCGVGEHDHDDDHSGHNHFLTKLVGRFRSLAAGHDHAHDDDHDEDTICIIAGNTAFQFTSMMMIITTMVVASCLTVFF